MRASSSLHLENEVVPIVGTTSASSGGLPQVLPCRYASSELSYPIPIRGDRSATLRGLVLFCPLARAHASLGMECDSLLALASLVPQPRTVERHPAATEIVVLNLERASVHWHSDQRDAASAAHVFVSLLESFGLPRPRLESSNVAVDDSQAPHSISLQIDAAVGSDSGNTNEYELTVSRAGLDDASASVRVRASNAAALLNGLCTLAQLLTAETRDASSVTDAEVDADGALAHSRPLPCAMTIRDAPRFAWRGLHLDCCRHFMPVPFIERFLDLAALHKFNVFHWHLTEDQGWRLEIPRLPELAAVAAWRPLLPSDRADAIPSTMVRGNEYGGFYTHEQVRHIVAYAAERHIRVIPEIEMPGHASAALAAYPHLGCTGGPYAVETRWGVFDDVMCAGKESTFAFLETVLEDVVSLFPDELIHIGGDECPTVRVHTHTTATTAVYDWTDMRARVRYQKRWSHCADCQERMRTEGLTDVKQLHSYFVARIATLVKSRWGKDVIGWDELLDAGDNLPDGAVIMSWRGTKGGERSIALGHRAVMSPTSHCYFDFRQSDSETEHGANWASTQDSSPVYLSILLVVLLKLTRSLEYNQSIRSRSSEYESSIRCLRARRSMNDAEHMRWCLEARATCGASAWPPEPRSSTWRTHERVHWPMLCGRQRLRLHRSRRVCAAICADCEGPASTFVARME